jgi:hypothetical protein
MRRTPDSPGPLRLLWAGRMTWGVWLGLIFFFLMAASAQAQQDTFSLGLRLTQSVQGTSSLTSSTGAALVQMAYGDDTKALSDQALTSLTGSSDPRIQANTQSFGDGTQTVAQIEAAAKALLLPQETALLNRMRAAAVAARVSGVIWVFAQEVRPLGLTRSMKLRWFLVLAPGGRVITSEPQVVDEDPAVVHMIYYSKAVGKSLPASYGWADGGLLKWQLRRYDGTPLTPWVTEDTAGAYDSSERDSEWGPRCLAAAQTLMGCVSGFSTAQSLMVANASRKSVIDYVRAVDVAYTPSGNGESTPDVKISFDLRQYTRISCTAGSYRCAGSVGFTVVEALDRYTLSDTETVPTKINSIRGLNSSRPLATFDVNLAVSEKPAAIDAYVLNPFELPVALVAKTALPGITYMAGLQVEMPPTEGEFTCPPDSQVVGNQCVKTQSSPAIETYSCPDGSFTSGKTCTNITSTPAAANATYSCPNGGTLTGTSCYVAGTSYGATGSVSYSCADGSTPVGGTCKSNTSTPATATTTYSCPSGGTLSGSTCSIASTSYAATGSVSYSCADGSTPVGSTCKSNTSTPATATTTYSCPSGGTLTGTSCYVAGTSYAATGSVSYSCADGSTPVGGTCKSNTSTPATATTTYSCPSGGTLSGATCTITTTSAATGNAEFQTVAADMLVNSATPGYVEFGTIGNNYWRGGLYDRSMTFSLSNLAAVETFALIRAEFDDWVSLTVNGSLVGVAPYGGDRLEIVNVNVEYCEENGCYTVTQPKVKYGPSSFGELELGQSWKIDYDVDLRSLLRTGSNTIMVRTIVGGYGETWFKFRTVIKPCPAGSNYVSGQCVSSSTYPATASISYSCADGSTPVGSTCKSVISSAATATTTYSCPSGGTLSGATCSIAGTSYAATGSVSYSCADGSTPVGGICKAVTSSAASATTTYSCPSGGTLSGSTCSIAGSSYAASASVSYSCADGSTPVGGICKAIISTPATATTTYTCPSGGTLSGATCTLPNTNYAATSSTSYTCASGILSGTQCQSTNSFAANASLSCTSGTLSGISCITESFTPATWLPLTCPD